MNTLMRKDYATIMSSSEMNTLIRIVKAAFPSDELLNEMAFGHGVSLESYYFATADPESVKLVVSSINTVVTAMVDDKKQFEQFFMKYDLASEWLGQFLIQFIGMPEDVIAKFLKMSKRKKNIFSLYVIMLTAAERIELAIDSLRLGAYDFVIKNEKSFSRIV